ncbi:MAG: penicillin-binding protein 2 [Hyphomicrobiales bacterium]|nr:penicillin-binding protein 2 [Hyphomicrobiales bacterium]
MTSLALLRGPGLRGPMGRRLPRFALARVAFAVGFALIALRLVALGFTPGDAYHLTHRQKLSTAIERPDIVDRKGRILATDIVAASLYADPSRIVGVDDTVEQLASVLSGLDTRALRQRLKGGGRFVWVQRQLSPRQQARIHELGLPGIGFITEPGRVYPAGATAAHVLGFVDVDNKGLAGIEKHIDGSPWILKAGAESPRDMAPIELSIDLSAQHALRAELADAMRRYQAKAASAVVLDVHTGEVLAMSSLPDFDPNNRAQAQEKDRFDRMNAGVFELGSVFKVLTTAAALDLGVVSLEDGYDATSPIRVASFTIDDFHGKRRWLSVPEVFIYSSNIGSAKMALDVGGTRYKAFLRRLGMLDRVKTELGDSALPIVPRRWQRVSTMTIGFGHGISVTPLHLAKATATLVNGGYAITPTFLRRTREESRVRAERVLKARTSDQIRHLMRLNVTRGTARRADAEGFRVGGKTGTAEKVVNGRYSRTALLTSVLGVFPADAPQYLILVVLDEPQRVAETGGQATAGVNAAPTTRRIVERIGPMLGVMPKFEHRPAPRGHVTASY